MRGPRRPNTAAIRWPPGEPGLPGPAGRAASSGPGSGVGGTALSLDIGTSDTGRVIDSSPRPVVELLIAPSVSLAGLLLVFIGFLLSRAKELGSRLSKPLRDLALWGLAPVAGALASAVLCVLELAYGMRVVPAEILFLVVVAGTMGYAVVALLRI